MKLQNKMHYVFLMSENNLYIYISKANNKEAYKIEFTPITTKNYTIIETVDYKTYGGSL